MSNDIRDSMDTSLESEEEKLFTQEVMDKKRTAHGVHGMASKRKGFKGKIVTPVDLLKGKAKKEYMGNGRVKRYNMYDVISYKEFIKKPLEEKTPLLKTYLEGYTTKELREIWAVGSGMIDYWKKKCGLSTPKTEKVKREKKPRKRVENNMIVENSYESTDNKEEVETTVQENKTPETVEQTKTTNPSTVLHGLIAGRMIERKSRPIVYNISLGGELTGEEIQKRMMDILSTMDKTKTYELTFQIEEK